LLEGGDEDLLGDLPSGLKVRSDAVGNVSVYPVEVALEQLFQRLGLLPG